MGRRQKGSILPTIYGICDHYCVRLIRGLWANHIMGLQFTYYHGFMDILQWVVPQDKLRPKKIVKLPLSSALTPRFPYLVSLFSRLLPSIVQPPFSSVFLFIVSP